MPDPTDQIRRLADLFLTRREPRTDQSERSAAPEAPPREATPALKNPQPEPSAGTLIECIIVGHLPVRAGLWLTQYADDVAGECGPTALMRLDPDQQILEVLHGDENVAQISAASTLEDAVLSTADRITRWIIRPDVGEGVDAVIEAEPDVVTILSGADEIAVVAAYRAIKDLHDAARRLDGRMPTIEVAVLGANIDASRRAVEKIAMTARESLGVDVTLSRCVQAMGPLGSTLHFRFPPSAGSDLRELIETIREPIELKPPRPVLTLANEGEPVEENMREADVTRSTTAPPGKASEVATNLEATPFSMPHRQEQPSAAGAPDAAPSTGKARLAPKPAVHVEPKRVVPNPEPREAPQPRALITWIDGLAALPVRCPDAKDVEIGVDTRGRPHLIGWDDQLRAISIATGWFNKHRELVRMACPDLNIEDDGEPVVHIFTSEPVRVSDLHGSPLRLHVLAPVEVGGQRGWYAAALNS